MRISNKTLPPWDMYGSNIDAEKDILPLHGSAVAINGKAYAFMGNSGAGKSTLASALINQGYETY